MLSYTVLTFIVSMAVSSWSMPYADVIVSKELRYSNKVCSMTYLHKMYGVILDCTDPKCVSNKGVEAVNGKLLHTVNKCVKGRSVTLFSKKNEVTYILQELQTKDLLMVGNIEISTIGFAEVYNKLTIGNIGEVNEL